MAKINLGAPNSSPQPPMPDPGTKFSPEPTSPQVSEPPSGSSSPDAPTHFDHIIEGAAVQETAAAAPPAPVMLGKDEFSKLFFTGFHVAHGVTGLQSLRIPEGDTAAAGCADALHDTIMDIPSLHFLLMPQGKWVPRILAIAAFTIPMGRNVSAELHSRRRPPAKVDFAAAKAATRSPSTDPDDPAPETVAALNGQ